MHGIEGLPDILVLFGAAVVVIVLSHRLRIAPIVGFLLTGMLVGPYGLGLIESTQRVEIIAELGVVFLLFLIGLELSVDRLKRLGRIMLLGGSLQSISTIAVVALVALIAGYPLDESLFFGFLVALSSTAIVLKMYTDRRELEAPQGKLAIGILLFQDFLVVPLLLVVPVLAGAAGGSTSAVLLRFGTGLLVLGAVFIGGRYLLPVFLRLIVQTRVRELFVIGSLFACLGAAILTERLGFSLALGAFLVGILIAESDFRHQVRAETGPFRDVFNSIFFISVGMLLDLGFAASRPFAILGLAAGILVLKTLITSLSIGALGYPTRTALMTGLGLAQIGEFSFVLVRAGHGHGLVDETHYQLAIASAVFTMLVTPLLIQLGSRIPAEFASRVRLRKVDDALEEAERQALSHHVVLVGFGLNGRHLARVLRGAGLKYVIVELNAETVREATARGEPILYGDATRPSILEECEIAHAEIAVFAISDPGALRSSVRLARMMAPELYIIARTRQLSEIEELRRCGANEVVAEEFETSIEIVTTVLTRLHAPRNVIRTQAKLLREDGYQMLRAPSPALGLNERVLRAIAAGTTDIFLLSSEHLAAGKTIRELGLRRTAGATVIAVVRGEHPFPNPAPDFALGAGDALVLVGNHEQIEAAFHFLERSTGTDA